MEITQGRLRDMARYIVPNGSRLLRCWGTPDEQTAVLRGRKRGQSHILFDKPLMYPETAVTSDDSLEGSVDTQFGA